MNNRLVGKDSIEYWANGQPGARDSHRGLINEYFSRTRTPQEPPPIFRSTMTNGRPLSGYFPLPTTTVHSSPVEDDMDLEQVLNFVDENFKEIGVSSVIVPEKKLKTRSATASKMRKSESCHLIGKVNPNILRTWEQLNRNDDDDDGGGQQGEEEVFEQRNNFQDFCEELAPFKVNYVTYDQQQRRKRSKDNLFYDSIDEDEDTDVDVSRSNATFELSSGTGESVIYRGGQSSLMTDSTDALLQDEMDGDPFRGGEGMAEFDSLDKKRFKCWSMDNNDTTEEVY